MTIAEWLALSGYVAWCLLAVNWRRTWPVLAAGGLLALVVIGLAGGVAWAFVFPTRPPIPNYLWHVGVAALLICIAFACGWLQGRLGWCPPDITFEPPPLSHDHDHH